jgi:hypothetical protein
VVTRAGPAGLSRSSEDHDRLVQESDSETVTLMDSDCNEELAILLTRFAFTLSLTQAGTDAP